MSDLASAQVILKPSAELIERVLERFEALGFECGPVIAGSFSITAPAEEFEHAFSVQLEQHQRFFTLLHGALEFPLECLPKELDLEVEAVVFTKPPDFGPTSF
jgi:hypothetical protein